MLWILIMPEFIYETPQPRPSTYSVPKRRAPHVLITPFGFLWLSRLDTVCSCAHTCILRTPLYDEYNRVDLQHLNLTSAAVQTTPKGSDLISSS